MTFSRLSHLSTLFYRLALTLVLLSQLSPSSAAAATSQTEEVSYACRPMGKCEVCPDDQLTTPACQPYQNRRLVHCVYLGTTPPAGIAAALHDDVHAAAAVPRAPTTQLTPRSPVPGEGDEAEESDMDRGDQGGNSEGGGGGGHRNAEFPSWEACERVVKKERADFFEFVLCNLLFTVTSLAVFMLRHRKLAARQYGRLAARIGIPIAFVGGAGGGGTGANGGDRS